MHFCNSLLGKNQCNGNKIFWQPILARLQNCCNIFCQSRPIFFLVFFLQACLRWLSLIIYFPFSGKKLNHKKYHQNKKNCQIIKENIRNIGSVIFFYFYIIWLNNFQNCIYIKSWYCTSGSISNDKNFKYRFSISFKMSYACNTLARK